MSNDNFPSQYFRTNDSFVHRRIGEEIILVPIRQHGAELHNIIRLNDVAAFIWERLDGKTSLQALAAAIAEVYQVKENQAAVDLEAFLHQMLEIEAIEGA